MTREFGLAETVKSPATWKTKEMEWDRSPLFAFTVTVYVPLGVDAIVDTIRMELIEPPGISVTLDAPRDNAGPLDTTGETTPVKRRVPVKPVLVRSIVDIVEPPATKLLGVGELAEGVKSLVTVTRTMTEWVVDPLVPVTVTV